MQPAITSEVHAVGSSVLFGLSAAYGGVTPAACDSMAGRPICIAASTIHIPCNYICHSPTPLHILVNTYFRPPIASTLPYTKSMPSLP